MELSRQEDQPSQNNINIKAMLERTNLKKMGQGTFGMVFSPALPNIINGTLTEFPENVTKLYFGKEAAKKSNKINAFMNILDTLHPNNSTKRRYSIKKYAKTYKKSQLPSTYFKSLTNKQQEQIGNNDLYLSRLPNLGTSFVDIVDPPNSNDFVTNIQRVNSIPFMTISYQVLQCMQIIKVIHDNGYIHGDIRESNIMLDPNGNMTIIDFDWFLPKYEFLNRFPSFFYSHPPECLFIFGHSMTPNEKGDYAAPWKFASKGFDLTKYYRFIKETTKHTQFFYDPEEAAMGMKEFITENEYDFKKQSWKLLQMKLFHNVGSTFIDSYGLGRSLSVLFGSIWNVPIREIGGVDDATANMFADINEFIKETLIPNMMHSNWTKRWTIDTCINEFTKILQPIRPNNNKNGGKHTKKRRYRIRKYNTIKYT